MEEETSIRDWLERIPIFRPWFWWTLGGAVALFLVFEGLFWLVGVDTLIQERDPARVLAELPSVFAMDGETFRTRASEDKTFSEQTFLVSKPENALRVFCLGGTAAQGFPWRVEDSFSGVLADVLKAQLVGRTVEVVNAAGNGYGIQRVRRVADEVLDYRPDILVIYVGNEEFTEPAMVDEVIRRGEPLGFVQSVLGRLRTYSLIRRMFVGSYDDPEPQATVADEDPDKDKGKKKQEDAAPSATFQTPVSHKGNTVFDPEKKRAVLEGFTRALRRVIRQAQDDGVKVAVVTVPANLQQWRPNKSDPLSIPRGDDATVWATVHQSGVRNLKAGNFSDAVTDFRQALKLAPGHAESYYELGQAQEGLERWEEAKKSYDLACDLDATPARRLTAVNVVIRHVGKEEGALVVDADAAFTQESAHGLVGMNLMEDYAHPSLRGHQLIAWHLWKSMKEAGWLGPQTQAPREAFDKVVAQRAAPEDENAIRLFNRGLVLQNQNRIDEAVAKYREALQISPDHTRALWNLSMLLMQANRQSEAQPHIERLIRVAPYHVGGRILYGAILAQRGEHDKAIAQYRYAQRLAPDSPAVLNNLGMVMLNTDAYDLAMKHFQEALKLDPDNAGVYNNIGKVMIKQEKFQEALKYFDEALARQADFAEAYYNVGVAQSRLGNEKEAYDAYIKAVQLEPNYVEAIYNLAVLYLRGAPGQKDPQARARSLDQAGVLLQRVVKLRPQFPQAHNNLGIVYAQGGNIAGAIYHFEQALKLEPNMPDARENLKRLQDALAKQREENQKKKKDEPEKDGR